MSRCKRRAVWLFLMLVPGAASADVFNTCTPPNLCNISPPLVPTGRPVTVTVTWRMQVDAGAGAAGTPVLISSAQGTLGAANGPTLAVFNRTISTMARTNSSVTIVETLSIPADVIARAVNQNLRSITYTRQFTDQTTAGADTGFVTFGFASSATAGFSISRLVLSFDDGTPMRIIARRAPLGVRAEIAYAGSGPLQGVWEVAGPESTAGTPIFRPLTTVRRQLLAGDSETLRGPELPADSIGLYLVRFRVTEPGLQDIPVLRYFVSEGTPGQTSAPRPLGLNGPPDLSLLAGNTRFAWEAIAGAKAYQLEVYAAPRDAFAELPNLGGEADRAPPSMAVLRDPPVTGMLVTAKQPHTTLSAAARAHLQPGRRYWWRVLAIGSDGAILAESPVREMQTP